MTRRRAFSASVALAIAGHACLVALVLAGPQAQARRPHARTVWLSGSAMPLPAGLASPAAAPEAMPKPAPLAESLVADALPAHHVDATVTGTREALAEPAIAELRDAVAPARLAAYRLPSELTRRAQVASAVDLTFRPDSASVARGGSARFIVLVSALGTVDDVVVESSTLPDEFSALAVAGFQRARFTPGMVDREPVPARVTIEVSDTPDRGA